ncbi:MAG: hypothetical protein Ta2D_09620 [Rickettsiales bacterium]|nr:MAG: hypothetical protein Ta2D_09620 [Rickettsiales bacterium]
MKFYNDKKEYGWGNKIIDNLSNDLINFFPNMTGLSSRNLNYMRKFAETYQDFEFVQQVVAQLTWGLNMTIITKIKDTTEREFYIKKSIENGWSRNVLNIQIESDLYTRQIKNEKTTNFASTMPKEDSDLANEIIKDPYRFDFLNLTEKVKEIDIEKALVQHLKEFLLELGTGFAYVGEQYHLQIENEDFYIDLLFYNFKLKCFVVIELKTGDFKPEYVGKLNFYINAVDDLLKNKDDKQTIGLLLCKNKNKTIAKYSLEQLNTPMGVAEYTIFPTIKEIEKELNK